MSGPRHQLTALSPRDGVEWARRGTSCDLPCGRCGDHPTSCRGACPSRAADPGIFASGGIGHIESTQLAVWADSTRRVSYFRLLADFQARGCRPPAAARGATCRADGVVIAPPRAGEPARGPCQATRCDLPCGRCGDHPISCRGACTSRAADPGIFASRGIEQVESTQLAVWARSIRRVSYFRLSRGPTDPRMQTPCRGTWCDLPCGRCGDHPTSCKGACPGTVRSHLVRPPLRKVW